MTDWNRIKTNTWLIENYAKNLDNPFDIFELLKKIEYTKLSWEGLNKALKGNELVETELNYLDKCLEKIEDEFIFSIDMWIYAIKDEDKNSILNQLDKLTGNNNKVGYELIYEIDYYKRQLPIIWNIYKEFLERKGVKVDESNYDILLSDLFQIEAIVRNNAYTYEVAYV